MLLGDPIPTFGFTAVPIFLGGALRCLQVMLGVPLSFRRGGRGPSVSYRRASGCSLIARFLVIPLQGVRTGWQPPAPSALLTSIVPITSQKHLNRLQLQGHFFHQDIFPILK